MTTHTFAVGESLSDAALRDIDLYAQAYKPRADAMARLRRALDAELAMRALELMTRWAEESPLNQSDCRQIAFRSHECGWRIVAVVLPPRGEEQVIADVIEPTFIDAIHAAYAGLVAAGELPIIEAEDYP